MKYIELERHSFTELTKEEKEKKYILIDVAFMLELRSNYFYRWKKEIEFNMAHSSQLENCLLPPGIRYMKYFIYRYLNTQLKSFE